VLSATFDERGLWGEYLDTLAVHLRLLAIRAARRGVGEGGSAMIDRPC
jgi:hypothetical protein